MPLITGWPKVGAFGEGIFGFTLGCRDGGLFLSGLTTFRFTFSNASLGAAPVIGFASWKVAVAKNTAVAPRMPASHIRKPRIIFMELSILGQTSRGLGMFCVPRNNSFLPNDLDFKANQTFVLRRVAARLNRPAPSKASVVGSGTVAVWV